MFDIFFKTKVSNWNFKRKLDFNQMDCIMRSNDDCVCSIRLYCPSYCCESIKQAKQPFFKSHNLRHIRGKNIELPRKLQCLTWKFILISLHTLIFDFESTLFHFYFEFCIKQLKFIYSEKYILRSPQFKFIYSEKSTKFCEIFTLLLSYVLPVKSKVKISQNFVAFSEYMNFIMKMHYHEIFWTL